MSDFPYLYVCIRNLAYGTGYFIDGAVRIFLFWLPNYHGPNLSLKIARKMIKWDKKYRRK
jgi:hypothetical protein